MHTADAGKHDARADAANPCKPTFYSCPLLLPASCFDGGLPENPTMDECKALCPSSMDTSSCEVQAGPSLECLSASCGNGRAYAGMARPHAPGQTSAVGRYFAETAQLEAASIDAFRILRDELRAHDAPDDLVMAARAAAADEVRHTRSMRRFARRYGPCPPRPRAGARAVRALEAVALENATEGCVRETYAALVAHHQAIVATDDELRETMLAIAADETRHAALSWQVAAWAEDKLDADAADRVRAARSEAVRELRASLDQGVPPSVTDVAGGPGGGACDPHVRGARGPLVARHGLTLEKSSS